MSRRELYATAAGVLVSVRSYRRESWGTKVAAYRYPTGGWHGWLWLHKLTKVTR